VLRGEIRIQDLAGDDNANIVWIQDYAVQVGQGPFRHAADPAKKNLLRELQALADGAPLTAWHRSKRLMQLISYSHVPDPALGSD
jgi:hypothetical protein